MIRGSIFFLKHSSIFQLIQQPKVMSGNISVQTTQK